MGGREAGALRLAGADWPRDAEAERFSKFVVARSRETCTHTCIRRLTPNTVTRYLVPLIDTSRITHSSHPLLRLARCIGR